ncbi:MAG TPA: hypothetical protein VEL28_04130 [Candidatus Binatia bacterium]|nr:hypothetical protein [Candidatus Binatia bacterium]
MIDKASIPVACGLPDDRLRARMREIESGIGPRIAGVRELEDGYELQFSAQGDIVEALGRFIAFERQCCPFLDFGLRVRAGGGPVTLTLSGTAEAKTFLGSAIEQWRVRPGCSCC